MAVFSDAKELATAHDLSEDEVIERLRDKSFMCMDSFGETQMSERRQERLVELMDVNEELNEENNALRAEIEKLHKFVDDIDAYALNLTDIGHMVTGDEVAWNIQRRIAQIDD